MFVQTQLHQRHHRSHPPISSNHTNHHGSLNLNGTHHGASNYHHSRLNSSADGRLTRHQSQQSPIVNRSYQRSLSGSSSPGARDRPVRNQQFSKESLNATTNVQHHKKNVSKCESEPVTGETWSQVSPFARHNSRTIPKAKSFEQLCTRRRLNPRIEVPPTRLNKTNYCIHKQSNQMQNKPHRQQETSSIDCSCDFNLCNDHHSNNSSPEEVQPRSILRTGSRNGIEVADDDSKLTLISEYSRKNFELISSFCYNFINYQLGTWRQLVDGTNSLYTRDPVDYEGHFLNHPTESINHKPLVHQSASLEPTAYQHGDMAAYDQYAINFDEARPMMRQVATNGYHATKFNGIQEGNRHHYLTNQRSMPMYNSDAYGNRDIEPNICADPPGCNGLAYAVSGNLGDQHSAYSTSDAALHYREEPYPGYSVGSHGIDFREERQSSIGASYWLERSPANSRFGEPCSSLQYITYQPPTKHLQASQLHRSGQQECIPNPINSFAGRNSRNKHSTHQVLFGSLSLDIEPDSYDSVASNYWPPASASDRLASFKGNTHSVNVSSSHSSYKRPAQIDRNHTKHVHSQETNPSRRDHNHYRRDQINSFKYCGPTQQRSKVDRQLEEEPAGQTRAKVIGSDSELYSRRHQPSQFRNRITFLPVSKEETAASVSKNGVVINKSDTRVGAKVSNSEETAGAPCSTSPGTPSGRRSIASSAIGKKSEYSTSSSSLVAAVTPKVSLAGAKRRLGFKRKGLSSLSIHRSEEVLPQEYLVRIENSIKFRNHVGSAASETTNDPGESLIKSDSFTIDQFVPDSSSNFVEGLGEGQIASRQALVAPYLGDIQLSISDRRGMLEVEVVRVRQLQPKAGAKQLPSPYVKVYLMRDKKCLGKFKTQQSKQTLNPLFQEQFIFRYDYSDCVLQVIVWGDYGKRDRKSLMGIVQIHLHNLDMSHLVIGWYRLFNAPSMANWSRMSSSKLLRQTIWSTNLGQTVIPEDPAGSMDPCSGETRLVMRSEPIPVDI